LNKSYYQTETAGVLKEKDKEARRIKEAADKDKEYTDALKGVPPDKKRN
jgi:hypothetical protein